MMIEDYLIIILLLLTGIILICLGIYLKTTYKRFIKEGVYLDFKVTKSKVEPKLDGKNNEIGKLFITTFTYKYENKVLSETLTTSKEYEVGTSYKGLYLPNSKFNKISVEKEGFNIPKKVPNYIILVGLYFIILVILILLNVKIIFLTIFTILIILILKLISILKK